MRSAYAKADTGRWIEDSGLVLRLLPDDDDGSRHQRFVIKLRGGQTLLVAHNTEVAERIPVGLGDRVHFRGMYDWNDLGGLVSKMAAGCATGAGPTARSRSGN